MPPAWCLTSILIFILGLILGLSIFAMFGESLVGEFGSPFIGTLIGASLGAIASMIIWVMTYWNIKSREEGDRNALRKALWNDVCALKDIAYRESKWWQKEMKDLNFGATEERLFSNLEVVVFEHNLSRISELSMRAADALLALRASTIVVRDALKMFYDYEDKIIKHVGEKKLTAEEASSQLKSNKSKVFYGLCQIAINARHAALALDIDGKSEKERRASFTPEEWEKRGKDYGIMDAVLDRLLERRRAGK